MHFEKGDYDKCIQDCEMAVERGRELRADYKTIARALTRKGTSLAKLGKLEDAIDTYQKALTEHRCRSQPRSALYSVLTPLLKPSEPSSYAVQSVYVRYQGDLLKARRLTAVRHEAAPCLYKEPAGSIAVVLMQSPCCNQR